MKIIESEKQYIYLDYAATTPVDPEVLASMQSFYNTEYANASSVHSMGHTARRAIDESRDTVAGILNCRSSEVVFTNGGTESVNIALLGAARAKGSGHIITSTIEHAAVLDSCKQLEKEGYSVTYISPEENGIVSVDQVMDAMQEDTILVSVMLANNEIGTLQSVKEIVTAVKTEREDIIIHTDACQATGAVSVDVQELGVDMMTINAGKIYGPKGMGALYIKKGVQLQPILFGGGQERRLRPGTENVSGIVGFAKAITLAEDRRKEGSILEYIRQLRDQLVEGLLQNIPGAILNGDAELRLPNNANIYIPGVDGDTLLLALDQAGIQVSLGSACAAGSVEPSHVLLALGYTKQDARRSIRFSLGKNTTAEEIERVIKKVPEIVSRLQKMY